MIRLEIIIRRETAQIYFMILYLFNFLMVEAD